MKYPFPWDTLDNESTCAQANMKLTIGRTSSLSFTTGALLAACLFSILHQHLSSSMGPCTSEKRSHWMPQSLTLNTPRPDTERPKAWPPSTTSAWRSKTKSIEAAKLVDLVLPCSFYCVIVKKLVARVTWCPPFWPPFCRFAFLSNPFDFSCTFTHKKYVLIL